MLLFVCFLCKNNHVFIYAVFCVLIQYTKIFSPCFYITKKKSAEMNTAQELLFATSIVMVKA